MIVAPNATKTTRTVAPNVRIIRAATVSTCAKRAVIHCVATARYRARYAAQLFARDVKKYAQAIRVVAVYVLRATTMIRFVTIA